MQGTAATFRRMQGQLLIHEKSCRTNSDGLPTQQLLQKPFWSTFVNQWPSKTSRARVFEWQQDRNFNQTHSLSCFHIKQPDNLHNHVGLHRQLPAQGSKPKGGAARWGCCRIVSCHIRRWKLHKHQVVRSSGRLAAALAQPRQLQSSSVQYCSTANPVLLPLLLLQA